MFDEDNLVSCADPAPVMALAEQIGFHACWKTTSSHHLGRGHVWDSQCGTKLANLIASMCAGADYIDDVDLVRAGGMKAVCYRMYVLSTVGTLLREFTFGQRPPT